MKNNMNNTAVIENEESEFERFGYKGTGKDRLFMTIAVIILFMITIWLTDRTTPWVVNGFKKAIEAGQNFGLKIRAKFVK